MILDTLILPLLINAACASFDGGAALYSHRFPGPDGRPDIIMPETGPVKFLTGPYPTWQSFLMAGAAEVVVLTAVSYTLKRCGIRGWWVPQLSVAGIHFYLGFDNIFTKQKYMRMARERGIY